MPCELPSQPANQPTCLPSPARLQGPHLVVVPLSVLPSWMSEFQRWSPQVGEGRLRGADGLERGGLV